MSRRDALRTVLNHVSSLRPLDAAQYCEDLYLATRDPYLLSLLSFSRCFGQQFEPSADAAAAARAESADPEAALFALAATAWAMTVWQIQLPADPIEQALERIAELEESDTELRAFTLYLLAEAALGTARLDL